MKRKTLFLGAVPFLVLNGFFVANLTRYPELRKYADRPELAIVSAIFVVIFALPSFLATLQWLGARRGAAALISLGAFAFFIETLALNTGMPYGAFSYGEKIGAKLPGGVPWTVAFAWAPLILGAYFWAHQRLRVLSAKNVAPQSWKIIALTALFATLCDGVLDPGAVSQRFWTYRNPSVYYGVPLSNYFGWLLSGIIGAAILHAFATSVLRKANALNALSSGAADVEQNLPTLLLGSAFLILTFWTSIAFFSDLWIPFALGVALLFVIGRDFLFPREYSRESF